MSLQAYNQKRDFKKTTEPKAGISKDSKRLMFVVQKHDASRLHYDFRLEMGGVLKSWAVPKGPSLDPKIKHLAMMVEDHPFDYRNFEGIIPKGEYGGGTVIVWDQGWYETIEDIKGKKAQENNLLKELAKGSVKVRLHGQKLNGEFALVKTNGMGENAWLLIKHDDEFATKKDVTKLDESVLSGKTIAVMEKTSQKVWKSGKAQTISDEKLAKAVKTKKKVKSDPELADLQDENPDPAKLLKEAPKTAIFKAVKPMLATLVDSPFDDADWQYEVKWDGYRALAFLNKNEVELLSRNKKSFNEKFYPVHELLKSLKLNAVLDGEVLVLNEKGISNFGQLQNWRSEADGALTYCVFDILWYKGKDLTGLTLVERQAILNEILPQNNDRIRISKVFDTNGTEFFEAAKKIGLEGIMAKRKSSVYSINSRSKDWLKIKINKRQEVVIAGFTKNKDTSKSFSSLILAVYKKGKLTFAGKVGTGFSNQDQKEMMKLFEPYITRKSPFEVIPDVNKRSRFQYMQPDAEITWMKPVLVAEVEFTEITSDGVFRHPSFKGMREDKKAKEVIREEAEPVKEIVKQADDKNSDNKEISKMNADNLLSDKGDRQELKIKGKTLEFNHLSKVYWPGEGITKRDLLNYYAAVSEYMLPYLKDRPQSLNRFPGGIKGKPFYQKDVKGKAPEWAKTFPYSTGDGEEKEYLLGNDLATLLWMVSLGCIEINPWFSRARKPDYPDYCVIDLDPDQQDFDQVIVAAIQVKEVLDAIDVPSFPKTSGSTGIHIYIPMGAKYTYEQTQLFARIIVEAVHAALPEFTTLERSIAARKGKMYLDFLQNRPGATIAGPYSVRPKPGATVSMPLDWDEVKPGLKMKDFTIFNTMERLKEKGDLFKGVLGKGIDLKKAIKKAKDRFQ
ncbi:DNA ligase D [Pedobacter soli]|uniref:DNA ligase (ATP) n=1 Tax=Pedobacter soli TaxID=390242 RepID=A0A1G6SAQ4_9SPHI|nr:DNA ligase D [Pedobacter soli]SDD13734.1 ATP-dependent DNA ligase LigD phosphoesterase module /ATP-dependent DNA ligase LigD polymerase module [Pedobacter soli]